MNTNENPAANHSQLNPYLQGYVPPTMVPSFLPTASMAMPSVPTNYAFNYQNMYPYDMLRRI